MKFAFVLVNDRTPPFPTDLLHAVLRADRRQISARDRRHLPYCDHECYELFYEAPAERKVA